MSTREDIEAGADKYLSYDGNGVVMDIANPDAFPYLNYPMASMEDLNETKRLVEEQGSRCLSI